MEDRLFVTRCKRMGSLEMCTEATAGRRNSVSPEGVHSLLGVKQILFGKGSE